MESTSLFDGFWRVIPVDEMFDVIKSVHQKSTAHSGVQKTFEIVSSKWYNVHAEKCIANS